MQKQNRRVIFWQADCDENDNVLNWHFKLFPESDFENIDTIKTLGYWHYENHNVKKVKFFKVNENEINDYWEPSEPSKLILIGEHEIKDYVRVWDGKKMFNVSPSYIKEFVYKHDCFVFRDSKES